MNKIRMIFDVTILANAVSRTGIFTTSQYLIREFLKNSDFEMTLYCKTDNKKVALENLKKITGRDDLPCIFRPTALLGNRFRPLAKKVLARFPASFVNLLYKFTKGAIKLLRDFKGIFQNQNIIKNEFSNSYDIFFSPCYEIPKEFGALKKFTIIYDVIPLIFKEYKNNPGGYWFLELCRNLNVDDICFSISAYTKKDFLEYLPHLKPENIIVTPLACDERFKPENSAAITEARKKYNIPENKKYIFSLCTLEPRKNLIRAVKCFASFIRKNNIDDLVFVLGGAHWDRFISILESEIENLNELKDKILKIGYVDDADQAALYSGALFFVYTSQYEGFGLPPLEAMSCGTPVITSNNSSLPEVVGDAGIMIDYDDDAAHIKAYEDYYFNEELRKENSKKGLEQAKKFSWEKCADIMVEEFKKRIKK